jgi:hypothetical protein
VVLRRARISGIKEVRISGTDILVNFPSPTERLILKSAVLNLIGILSGGAKPYVAHFKEENQC